MDFDPIFSLLNHSLNMRLINQNVISSNIANADTPNYKTKKVEFESILRESFESGKQDTSISPEIYEDPQGLESLDGNTVDRTAEMANLAENQLSYELSTEMLRKKLGMLKYVITEGGGSR